MQNRSTPKEQTIPPKIRRKNGDRHMALYSMADFHLSESTKKPMDIFGPAWERHSEKIAENWPLTDDDTIVMPGDFSWAMTLDEVRADFDFLAKLKGKKILSKGNHDYWWNSMKKITEFTEQYGNIGFLHNNAPEAEGVSLCGTRGWIQEPGEAADIKVLKREAERLERSILAAEKEPVVFLHYPPICGSIYCEPIMEVLVRHNIKQCFYGHLHGKAIRAAKEGMYYGVEFHLVSADHLGFCPLKIRD